MTQDRKANTEKIGFTRYLKLVFVLKVHQNHKGGTLYKTKLSQFAGAVHEEEIAEEKLWVFELN